MMSDLSVTPYSPEYQHSILNRWHTIPKRNRGGAGDYCLRIDDDDTTQRFRSGVPAEANRINSSLQFKNASLVFSMGEEFGE